MNTAWKLLAIAAFLSGCGGNVNTAFEGTPTAPVVDTGGSAWTNSPTPPAVHNTKYCQVDAKGNITTTTDQIDVQDGDRKHGVGGGCVARPIRDVWGVVLNHAYMKDDQVDDYKPTSVPSLTDPAHKLYFVFDIESTVHALAGLVTVDWITRWYHTITFGTYESPYQVAINLQKISGSTHIDYDKEGYVLDRVTDKITSFVMEQTIKADEVDTARIHKNITVILDKMRKGEPATSVLTPHPPTLEELSDPEAESPSL